MPDPTAWREHRLARPLDLADTLGPMRRGAGDPCLRLAAKEVWRATNTPEGPATLHLVVDTGAAVVRAEAWGDGAEWACDHVPALVGDADDPDDFSTRLAALTVPGADLLRDLHRRHPGLRIPWSGAVTEAAVPVTLEQKVIGQDAWASYRALVRRHGIPAPGSADLHLPPTVAVLKSLPSWHYHRAGVEGRRADTIRRLGEVAHRLDEPDVDAPEVARRLRSITGVGDWTVAEVARIALGDADAVSTGDFHLPHQVAFAFTGQRRSDDETMLTLLEPFRPHRGRVIRLVMLGTPLPPRRGPRRGRSSISRI